RPLPAAARGPRGLPAAARLRRREPGGGLPRLSRADGRRRRMTPKQRLIVALDVPTVEQATALVARLSGHVGMVKVGSQLGPEFVRYLVARDQKVFLDLKYHDIPNTVANAVSRAAHLGVSLMTLHAMGGKAMLEAAAGALPAMGARLLAITILTSHDEETLG